MSILGRKLRRWTYSEVQILHRMYQSNATRKEMAEFLNMTEERIRQRLQWEMRSPESKFVKKKRLREKYVPRGKTIHTERFYEVVKAGPKPLDETIQDRNQRAALMPRDLTAAFFGDPLPGYSALERRA